MRLETSRLIRNADLQEEDLSYHKINRFYNERFLTKPEFMFKNHLIELKEKEIEMLEQSLIQHEADEAKREAIVSQGSAASKVEGKAKGKESKPPAKAEKGKGTTPIDDVNVPKNIDIEYEEVPSEPDFMIMEKDFKSVRKPLVEQKAKPGSKSGMQS